MQATHVQSPKLKSFVLVVRTYIVNEFGNQKAERLFFVLSAFSFLDLYAV